MVGIPVETPAANRAAFAALGAAVGTSHNGFTNAKAKIEAGKSATFLIWGDSTGNQDSGPREWPYLFADALFAEYPTHSIYFHEWSGSALSIAGTQVQTGSTSARIDIWNFSVAGAAAYYGLGNFFDAGLRGVTADCMVINHGHNHASGGVLELIRGELAAAVMTYRLYHPDTPIVAMNQNPWRDSDDMALVFAAWNTLVDATDISQVDVYSAFIALGKDASLYGDNIHPSQTGQDLWGGLVWDHWQEAAATYRTSAPSSLAAPIPSAANAFNNGAFDVWTTSPGAPDNWTAGGTITVSKELTIVDRFSRGYSAKLLGTTASAYIQRSFSVLGAKLAGKPITAAVRLYRDAANPGTICRWAVIVASVSAGNPTYTTRSVATQQTGWIWWCLSGIVLPADTTSVILRLYHDTAGSPSTEGAFYDQAVVMPGMLPRRMA